MQLLRSAQDVGVSTEPLVGEDLAVCDVVNVAGTLLARGLPKRREAGARRDDRHAFPGHRYDAAFQPGRDE